MPMIMASVFHAPILAALHARCFSRGWSAQEFADLLALPGHFGFLLEADDAEKTPCGFCLCRAMADEAELLTIGVAPEWLRRGYARLMLAAAEHAAHDMGAAQFFLEVSEANLPAGRLYEQMGFVTVGLRKDYYLEIVNNKHIRSNACIMAKDIESVD